MYRNKAVLEAIERVLSSRGLTLEEFEDEIGWSRGTMRNALQPLEEMSHNRNIKLPAELLGLDAVEFFEMVRQIDAVYGV